MNVRKFSGWSLLGAFAAGSILIAAIVISALRFPTVINIPGITYTTPRLNIDDFVVPDQCTGNDEALLAATFISVQPVYRCQEVIRTKDGIEVRVNWDKETVGIPYLEPMWSGAVIPVNPVLEPGEYTLQLYGDDNAYIELMDINLYPVFREYATWENGPKNVVFTLDASVHWIKVSHKDNEGISEYNIKIERLKAKEITD